MPENMSYKCEVYLPGGEHNSNALRFATYDEADSYGYDLLCRWFVPERYDVVESSDAVNYRFVGGRAEHIESVA